MKYLFLILTTTLLLTSCKNDTTINSNSGEKGFDAFPVWSPLGGQIIYAGGNEVDGWSLFLIDITGTNKQKINSTKDFQVDWSPDGQWIVYSYGGHIYKRKLSDTSTIKLTTQGNNFYPSWSKDGQWIAFDSNNDSPNGMNFVWKMKSDGTSKKQILHAPTVGEIRQPNWFPDGIRIAVVRYVLGRSNPEIAIIDTAGNSISILTNDGSFDRSPKVSSDGNFIVYHRDVNYGQICIVGSDGTNLQQVTTGNTIYPNWSPDGNLITYTNTSQGDGRIWIMEKTGILARKISY